MPDSSPAAASLYWHPGEASASAGRVLSAARYDAHTGDCFDYPLDWLDGDFRRDAWTIDGDRECGELGGWYYRRSGRLAFAAYHAADLDTPDAVAEAGRAAYRGLFALQRRLGLAYPQRVWHWLSDVTGGVGDDERYQRFCRGRAEAIDRADPGWTPLPPATLVGSGCEGVRMHALLADTPMTPIENPRQISAFNYPRDYGIRAPAFARAGVARLGAARHLLISGTASIVGHATRHVGDLDAQIDETLTNIDAVIAAAAPHIGRRSTTDLQCIKAYLRHPSDADAVRARLARQLPGVACALAHAPLCREDLLVEFEAQMRVD